MSTVHCSTCDGVVCLRGEDMRQAFKKHNCSGVRVKRPSPAAVALATAGMATLAEGLELALREGALSPEVRATTSRQLASLRQVVEDLRQLAHTRQLQEDPR